MAAGGGAGGTTGWGQSQFLIEEIMLWIPSQIEEIKEESTSTRGLQQQLSSKVSGLTGGVALGGVGAPPAGLWVGMPFAGSRPVGFVIFPSIFLLSGINNSTISIIRLKLK